MIPELKHLPYTERLKKLNLPSLKYRRIRGDMINVYKILNDNDQNSSNKRIIQLNETSHSTRGCRYKTNIRKFSFALRVTNIWNSLNNSTTNASSINSFKKLLDEDILHLKYEID